MITQLREAAEKVASTIREKRQNDEGFGAVCEALGLDTEEVTAIVDEQVATMNGDGNPVALMRGLLIGATVAHNIATSDVPTELPTDGLDWAAIGKLLPPHPLRTRILRYLAQHGEASPNGIAVALDEALGNVSYHMKALAGHDTDKPIKDSPLLELSRTEPRRGALEHFYVLTDVAKGGAG